MTYISYDIKIENKTADFKKQSSKISVTPAVALTICTKLSPSDF